MATQGLDRGKKIIELNVSRLHRPQKVYEHQHQHEIHAKHQIWKADISRTVIYCLLWKI